ncbi:MAG: MBL fold metallo-hydrolase [Deltaproteobacteria bacterium]|nr:MBL fold metallo-hydrolase [Deltaproteobacteria bacterium]
MKITTLIENDLASGVKNLKSEFGLSLHLEFDGRSILFDTGSSGKFIDNARELGIDIKKIDTVIISHAHFDHTGGLKRFLTENKTASIYISEHVKSDYYYRPVSFFKKYIGIDHTMLDENMARFHFVSADMELETGIRLVTAIQHNHKIPSDSKNLYTRNKNGLENDNFEHEMILTVDDNGKLFIFTGCSHNGILNMVDTVRSKNPAKEIIVIGGFHMFNPITKGMSERKQDVIDIAKVFNDAPYIDKIITGHCTGEKAFSVLNSIMGGKLLAMKTGSVYEF